MAVVTPNKASAPRAVTFCLETRSPEETILLLLQKMCKLSQLSSEALTLGGGQNMEQGWDPGVPSMCCTMLVQWAVVADVMWGRASEVL